MAHSGGTQRTSGADTRRNVSGEIAETEIATSSAELERRLAQRTVERDDVARDEAIAELARTNAELERGSPSAPSSATMSRAMKP